MHSLKFLVIFLGFLIIMALGFLVYGFAKKSSDPNWRLLQETPQKSEAYRQNLGTPEFGNIFLNLPKNYYFQTIIESNQMLFIFTGPTETQTNKIYILDAKNGKIRGTINP
jgi:hypothetical protein